MEQIHQEKELKPGAMQTPNSLWPFGPRGFESHPRRHNATHGIFRITSVS